MFIFQIDPGKILGADNKKDISKSIENPDSVLLSSMSRTHPITQPPGVPIPPNNQIPPAMLLGQIMDLSNNLLMDPYHHLSEISQLGKYLAEYTHTEYDLGKADKLFDFFLRDKSDLTGDGKIDHNDVIAFWSGLGGSGKPCPNLPPVVHIDLGNDKKTDYFIRDGKIYQLIDDYIKEVDHIEGVSLKELAEKIRDNNNNNSSSTEFKFDINHDGNEDKIFASFITLFRQMSMGSNNSHQITDPMEQINNRPIELD